MNITQDLLRRLAADPAEFRRVLRFPGARGQATFADVLAPFQVKDFAALDPAFQDLRAGRAPAIRRFWLERTKGASKDTDLAVLLLWLIAFCPRMLTCQVGAADADQADELRLAAKGIVRLNGELFEAVKLEVQADRIVSRVTDSRAQIIPADVAGSHGARPDLLILNELSHVTKREFADNLLDNAEKVPHGVVILATNAGFIPSWQWDLRETVRPSPRWYFSCFSRPAPWIDAAGLEERRRSTTHSRFRRLWHGEWASGGGDAIDPEAIRDSLTLAGPMAAAEPGWVFVGGLDLGLSRDASALVVVGKHVGWTETADVAPEPERSSTMEALLELEVLEADVPEAPSIHHPPTGRLRLAAVQVWRPGHGRKLQLEQVELAILEAHRRFGLAGLAYDLWQAAYLAERIRKQGINAIGVDPVAQALRSQAAAVLEAFQERQIDLYPDPDLFTDLTQLRIVEKSYGIRLHSPRGPSGHGDSASALALALNLARRTSGRPRTVEGPLLCWPQ